MYGTDVGLKQRSTLLARAALSEVLVQKLTGFRGACSVGRLLHHAKCVVLRRHFLVSKGLAEGLFEEGQRLYEQQRYGGAARSWGQAALLQHGASHAFLSNRCKGHRSINAMQCVMCKLLRVVHLECKTSSTTSRAGDGHRATMKVCRSGRVITSLRTRVRELHARRKRNRMATRAGHTQNSLHGTQNNIRFRTFKTIKLCDIQLKHFFPPDALPDHAQECAARRPPTAAV